MDIDIQKQRRNLLGSSIGLAIYELAGGTTGKISLMDGGIELENPEYLVALGYGALLYFLWRYWLYAKPEHKKFREMVAQAMHDFSAYQSLVAPHLAEFQEKSGVEVEEAFQRGYDQVPSGESAAKTPFTIPVVHEVVARPFRRILEISVRDVYGNFVPNRVQKRIGFIKYEMLWLRSTTLLIFSDKTFSDLYVPYLLAAIALVAGGARWLA